MKTTPLFVLAFGSLALPAMGQTDAFRGTHIGFETATGSAGEKLQLRTGYGTSGAPESEQWAYQFGSGPFGAMELQTRSARFAVDPNAPFAMARYNLLYGAPATWDDATPSPVAGWYAQSSLAANPVTHRQTFNPTGGDFFVSGGKIVGGDYAWEIESVTPVYGSAPASFAIGLMDAAGITIDSQRKLLAGEATSDPTPRFLDTFGVFDASQAGGGAMADRLVNVGYGNHFHGWGFFVSQQGVYDVTMRLHDLNGRYLASDAFVFRVSSVPAPGAAFGIVAAGLAALRRRR